MLFKRQDFFDRVCVLKVSPEVLDLNGVVITDGKASSGPTRFAPAPNGLKMISRDLTFAERWTHVDFFEHIRHKRVMCAEVLVPDFVPPHFIKGAYGSSSHTIDKLRTVCDLDCAVNRHLFFNR
jgi:hypothetical protein